MSSDTKSVRKKRRVAESDIRAAITQFRSAESRPDARRVERAIVRSDESSRGLKHSDPSPVAVDVGSLLVWCDDVLQGVLLELGRAVDEATDEISGLCDTLSAGDFNTSSRGTLTVGDSVAGQLLSLCLDRQFCSIGYRLGQYERRKKEIEDLMKALKLRWQDAPTPANLRNGGSPARDGAKASENSSTRSVRSRKAV